MSSHAPPQGGYSRTQWGTLSIQDRIRAMNETLDEVVDPSHEAPRSCPPADRTNGGSGSTPYGRTAANGEENGNEEYSNDNVIPARSSVVDIWRKREGAAATTGGKTWKATSSNRRTTDSRQASLNEVKTELSNQFRAGENDHSNNDMDDDNRTAATATSTHTSTARTKTMDEEKKESDTPRKPVPWSVRNRAASASLSPPPMPVRASVSKWGGSTTTTTTTTQQLQALESSSPSLPSPLVSSPKLHPPLSVQHQQHQQLPPAPRLQDEPADLTILPSSPSKRINPRNNSSALVDSDTASAYSVHTTTTATATARRSSKVANLWERMNEKNNTNNGGTTTTTIHADPVDVPPPAAVTATTPPTTTRTSVVDIWKRRASPQDGGSETEDAATAVAAPTTSSNQLQRQHYDVNNNSYSNVNVNSTDGGGSSYRPNTDGSTNAPSMAAADTASVASTAQRFSVAPSSSTMTEMSPMRLRKTTPASKWSERNNNTTTTSSTYSNNSRFNNNNNNNNVSSAASATTTKTPESTALERKLDSRWKQSRSEVAAPPTVSTATERIVSAIPPTNSARGPVAEGSVVQRRWDSTGRARMTPPPPEPAVLGMGGAESVCSDNASDYGSAVSSLRKVSQVPDAPSLRNMASGPRESMSEVGVGFKQKSSRISDRWIQMRRSNSFSSQQSVDDDESQGSPPKRRPSGGGSVVSRWKPSTPSLSTSSLGYSASPLPAKVPASAGASTTRRSVADRWKNKMTTPPLYASSPPTTVATTSAVESHTPLIPTKQTMTVSSPVIVSTSEAPTTPVVSSQPPRYRASASPAGTPEMANETPTNHFVDSRVSPAATPEPLRTPASKHRGLYASSPMARTTPPELPRVPVLTSQTKSMAAVDGTLHTPTTTTAVASPVISTDKVSSVEKKNGPVGERHRISPSLRVPVAFSAGISSIVKDYGTRSPTRRSRSGSLLPKADASPLVEPLTETATNQDAEHNDVPVAEQPHADTRDPVTSTRAIPNGLVPSPSLDKNVSAIVKEYAARTPTGQSKVASRWKDRSESTGDASYTGQKSGQPLVELVSSSSRDSAPVAVSSDLGIKNVESAPASTDDDCEVILELPSHRGPWSSSPRESASPPAMVPELAGSPATRSRRSGGSVADRWKKRMSHVQDSDCVSQLTAPSAADPSPDVTSSGNFNFEDGLVTRSSADPTPKHVRSGLEPSGALRKGGTPKARLFGVVSSPGSIQEEEEIQSSRLDPPEVMTELQAAVSSVSSPPGDTPSTEPRLPDPSPRYTQSFRRSFPSVEEESSSSLRGSFQREATPTSTSDRGGFRKEATPTYQATSTPTYERDDIPGYSPDEYPDSANETSIVYNSHNSLSQTDSSCVEVSTVENQFSISPPAISCPTQSNDAHLYTNYGEYVGEDCFRDPSPPSSPVSANSEYVPPSSPLEQLLARSDTNFSEPRLTSPLERALANDTLPDDGQEIASRGVTSYGNSGDTSDSQSHGPAPPPLDSAMTRNVGMENMASPLQIIQAWSQKVAPPRPMYPSVEATETSESDMVSPFKIIEAWSDDQSSVAELAKASEELPQSSKSTSSYEKGAAVAPVAVRPASSSAFAPYPDSSNSSRVGQPLSSKKNKLKLLGRQHLVNRFPTQIGDSTGPHEIQTQKVPTSDYYSEGEKRSIKPAERKDSNPLQKQSTYSGKTMNHRSSRHYMAEEIANGLATPLVSNRRLMGSKGYKETNFHRDSAPRESETTVMENEVLQSDHRHQTQLGNQKLYNSKKKLQSQRRKVKNTKTQEATEPDSHGFSLDSEPQIGNNRRFDPANSHNNFHSSRNNPDARMANEVNGLSDSECAEFSRGQSLQEENGAIFSPPSNLGLSIVSDSAFADICRITPKGAPYPLAGRADKLLQERRRKTVAASNPEREDEFLQMENADSCETSKFELDDSQFLIQTDREERLVDNEKPRLSTRYNTSSRFMESDTVPTEDTEPMYEPSSAYMDQPLRDVPAPYAAERLGCPVDADSVDDTESMGETISSGSESESRYGPEVEDFPPSPERKEKKARRKSRSKIPVSVADDLKEYENAVNDTGSAIGWQAPDWVPDVGGFDLGKLATAVDEQVSALRGLVGGNGSNDPMPPLKSTKKKQTLKIPQRPSTSSDVEDVAIEVEYVEDSSEEDPPDEDYGVRRSSDRDARHYAEDDRRSSNKARSSKKKHQSLASSPAGEPSFEKHNGTRRPKSRSRRRGVV